MEKPIAFLSVICGENPIYDYAGLYTDISNFCGLKKEMIDLHEPKNIKMSSCIKVILDRTYTFNDSGLNAAILLITPLPYDVMEVIYKKGVPNKMFFFNSNSELSIKVHSSYIWNIPYLNNCFIEHRPEPPILSTPPRYEKIGSKRSRDDIDINVKERLPLKRYFDKKPTPIAVKITEEDELFNCKHLFSTYNRVLNQDIDVVELGDIKTPTGLKSITWNMIKSFNNKLYVPKGTVLSSITPTHQEILKDNFKTINIMGKHAYWFDKVDRVLHPI